MADETAVIKIQYDTDEAVSSINKLTTAISNNQAKQVELKEKLKEGKISQQDYATQMAEVTQSLNRDGYERKKLINIIQSEISSVKRAKAENQVLREERNKLSSATEAGRKKIAEYNKKIDENTRAIKGNVDSQSKWHMGVQQMKSAYLLIAGAIGGAVAGLKKFGAAVINSSDALKDDFEVAASQASAAFDIFKTSIATMDFSNFFSNMKEAVRLAEEYTRGMQKIEDLTRSLGIQEVKQQGELSRLKKIYQDANSSITEQTDALNEYKRIILDLGTKETKYTSDAYALELRTAAQRTGLAEDEIKMFIEQNDKMSELTNSALELKDAQIKVFTPMGAWKLITKSLTGSLKETSDANAELIKSLVAAGMAGDKATLFAEKIRKLSPEKINQLTIAAKAYYSAQNKFDEETVRQETKLNSLEKEKAKTKAENVEREKLYIDDIALKTIESDQIVYDNKEDLAQQEIYLKNRVLRDKAEAQAKADAEELAKAEQIATAKIELAEAAEKAAKQFAVDQFNAKIDNELNKTKVAAEAKEQVLKDELDKGNISQEAYEKKLAALKLKTRKAEAKAEKKKALFEIAIQTLIGSIKAVAASPVTFGLPFLPFVVGEGLLVAGLAAAKPEPQFAKGGIVGGKSHAQGGTKFVGSDGSHFEAERGEAMFVLKKDATAEIAALSAINESFGGRSFGSGSDRLEDGGNVKPVDIESEVNKAMQRTPIYVKVSDVSLGLSSVEKVKSVGVI